MKKVTIISFVAICLSLYSGCHKTAQEVRNENAFNAMPSSNNMSGFATCGPTTLSAADAYYWQCTQALGYVCSNPNGCPVNGNLVMKDAFLLYTPPMPNGQGYLLTSQDPKYLIPSVAERNVDGEAVMYLYWECAIDAGCMCGSSLLAKGNQCLENFDDVPFQMICLKTSGCDYNGLHYTYLQKWTDTSNNYVRLLVEKETSPYRSTPSSSQPNQISYDSNQSYQPSSKPIYHAPSYETNDTEYSSTSASNSESYDTGYSSSNNASNNSQQIPPGYRIFEEDYRRMEHVRLPVSEVELQCVQESGCTCGNDICPQGFVCHYGKCMHVNILEEEGKINTTFYCDRNSGCKCGEEMCPQNGFCTRSTPVRKSGYIYECFMTNHSGLSNRNTLYQFMKSSTFTYYVIYNDNELSNKYSGEKKTTLTHEKYKERKH